MENYLLSIFILNFALVLCDASIGFFIVPHLIRRGMLDEEDARKAVRNTPTLLAVAVAVYMFFICLAYSRRNAVFLLIVSGVILTDIIGQLVVCSKMRKNMRN
jgi:uncharacterized protein YacL